MTPSPSVLFGAPGTPVQRRDAEAVSSSEAASLGGKPAKTPIIAGAICGGVLLISWIIGFAIYFRKRANRKKRKRLAEVGLCDPPPEKVDPTRSSSERIVIPPDPAVLLGYAKPGEMVHVPEKEKSSSRSPSYSRTQSSNEAPLATPSRPVPLVRSKSKSHSHNHSGHSHGHGHKKSHSHSSSKSNRPSSPKKAEAGDEETAPLNPHVNDSPQL